MSTFKKMKNCHRPLVIIMALTAVFLSGCQTLPSTVDKQLPDVSWSTNSEPFVVDTLRLIKMSDWRYSGKSAVRSIHGNDQINIDWSFSDSAHSIRLFGPLGVGAVKIEYDSYGVQMSDNKGVVYSGSDPRALLYDVTGLSLPLSSLQYWLFAVPEPGAKFEYREYNSDSTDRQLFLRQHGWEINFSEFVEYSSEEPDTQWVLPKRITANGYDAEGQPVRIKLFTKSWDFAPQR